MKLRNLYLSLCVLAVMLCGCHRVRAQVPVNLGPEPKATFFNANAPCAGCSVYTYQAGTTTPLATYTDSTGATPNANPVVLDANGQANIWYQNLSYKIVLKDANGSTLYTTDNFKTLLLTPVITGPASISTSGGGQTSLTLTNSGSGSSGLAVTSSGTSNTGIHIASSGTGAIGESITGSASTALQAQTNLSNGTAVIGIAALGSGINFGLIGDTLSASGFGVRAINGGGGVIIDALGSLSTEVFSVQNNGEVITSHGVAINGATEITAQSGTGGTVAMTAGPSISAPTISGASTISIGTLTNAAGLQLFSSSTTCATTAAVGGQCTTGAITLPSGYSDTNYRIACSGVGPSNVPIVQFITKSNTTFTITIAALTAANASFTSYDCIAGHN